MAEKVIKEFGSKSKNKTRPRGGGRVTRQPISGPRTPTGQRTVNVGALRWAGLAQEYGQKTGVPPEFFLALIQAESGGNNQAVGDNGASVGLFQLHERGVGAGLSVAQRYDPRLQFEKMAPRIQRAYQSGIAKGLQGADLAIHVGKEAERPAAGRETKYGFTYAQVTDALKNDGKSFNVGDFSPSGLLYGPSVTGQPTRPTMRPASSSSPMMIQAQPANIINAAPASPMGNNPPTYTPPATPPTWPTGNILGNSTPQTPVDYSDDADTVTLFKTPFGPVQTSRGQARRAVTTSVTLFGGILLIVLAVLWLIFSRAKGGMGGVVGRVGKVAFDLAKGGE